MNRRALTHVGRKDVEFRPDESNDDWMRGTGNGLEGDVRSFVNIVRRRAAWIKVIFLSVVALALVATLLRDPVYRATALIEIRKGGGDVPSIAGLFVDGDPTEESLRTHFELLQSATLATHVIQNLGLDELEEFDPDGEALPQAMVERFRERLLVNPVPQSRLVRVAFEAGSPELAASIVNEIVSAYGILRTDGRAEAAQRLEVQVGAVGERLQESEEALRAYTEANGLPYLVEEDLTTEIGTRLRGLRGQLAEAEAVRRENEALFNVIRSDGRVDIITDPALADLEAQLSGLQREYARLSATFTDAYPATGEVLRQIEHVRGQIQETQSRVADRVGSEFRLATQREEMISEAIVSEEERANALGPESGSHHLLRQAVLANRSLYVTLNERYREAETAAAIGPTDFVVVDPAAPPTEPFRPVFGMTMGLAAMLGLVLGLAGAFARELLDDTVQSVEDMPGRIGAPLLGMIPTHDGGRSPALPGRSLSRDGPAVLPWPGVRRKSGTNGKGEIGGGPGLVPAGFAATGKESDAMVDAFSGLRTAMLMRDGARYPHSVLVSSCRAGEGKTTVSVNLALSFAELGHRVLLVDADLRRPAVHTALNLNAGPGLVDYLRGESDWKASVRFDVVDGLNVLPSGGPTSRAADLLAGGLVAPMLREAEAIYDYVIVDAPALFINATDATLLARDVDGVVVVVRSRSTPRMLVDRIHSEVPNLIGVVLNDLTRGSMPDFSDYFAAYGEPHLEKGAADDVRPTYGEWTPVSTDRDPAGSGSVR